MKKRSVLRVLALVLCTAMMLTVMPAMQLSADTVITEIWSYYEPPVGGYTPFDLGSMEQVLIPAYPDDPILSVTILKPMADDMSLDVDNWTRMDNDEPFEAGVVYAWYVTVELGSDGYAFDPNLAIQSDYPGTITIDEVYGNYVSYWIVFDEACGFPADSYGIALGDTVVTEENADDILGDGTAQYLPDSRKLILTDCTIDSAFVPATGALIGLYAKGNLTIEINGDCAIDLSGLDASTRSSIGLYCDQVLTVVGDGNFSIQAGDAIGFSCGVTAIENLSLQVGGAWFFGTGKTEAVSSTCCAIHAGGVFMEPINDISQLTLSGLTHSIILETGSVETYAFDVTAGETPTTPPHSVDPAAYTAHYDEYTFVNLVAQKDPDYTLYVCDIEVTPWNEDDIFGDGTAAYDPATHTLTLENTSIDNASRITTAYGLSFAAIYATQPLTVNLIGDNEIDLSALPYPADTEVAALVLCDSTHLDIVGDGNLTAAAGDADPSTLHYGLLGTYDIDINMTGDLYLSAPDDVAFGAICALNGLLHMEMAGDVSIYNGSSTSTDRTDAIFANFDIELVNHGEAVIRTGDHAEDNIVLLANHAIRIVNDGNLTIATGDMTFENSNIGMMAPHTISILNAGTRDISTGDAVSEELASCYGIKTEGMARIVNHSTMSISTGNANRDSDALEIGDTLRLLGSGTLNVTTGNALYTSAVYFPSLFIGGDGTYTFSTGQATGWGGAVCGTEIRIEDDVTVTVNALGCIGGDVVGINAYEEGLLISTTGDVTVNVGDAATADGYKAIGLYTDEMPLCLFGDGDVSVSVGGGYNSYAASCGTLFIGSPANVSLVASSAALNESIGVHATVEDPLFLFAGTDPDNIIYIEGATCAMDALPLVLSYYTVQGSTVLPAAMETVNLTKDVLPTLKAIALTGIEPPEDPSEEPSEEPVSEPEASDTVSEPVSEPNLPTKYGDADGSGDITMKDVLLVRKAIAGLIGADKIDTALADVDSDGNLTMKDVLLLRKFIAGLIDRFPAETPKA